MEKISLNSGCSFQNYQAVPSYSLMTVPLPTIRSIFRILGIKTMTSIEVWLFIKKQYPFIASVRKTYFWKLMVQTTRSGSLAMEESSVFIKEDILGFVLRYLNPVLLMMTWNCFEKVDAPEESYRLTGNDAGTTVQNWFLQEDDIDTDQYFSLKDRAEDLLENEDTHKVLKEYLPEITGLLEKGVIPLGLAMTSILSRDKEIAKTVDLAAMNLALLKITKR